MSEDPHKKPNSNLEALFGLIDSLQKHKRKLAQKPEPALPELQTRIPSKPWPIKSIVGGVILLITLSVIALQWRSREAVQTQAPFSHSEPSVAKSASLTATTSTLPRRIIQQPMPVPAHLQIHDDPEEQRERDLREQEYDRMQNPELPPHGVQQQSPDENNISN